MDIINRIITISLLSSVLGACGSGGTSSSGGGGEDASSCVSRTFNTVYVNECNFDINVIVLEPGATSFHISANNASTQPASSSPFGACRAPSVPVLNSNNSSFTCN